MEILLLVGGVCVLGALALCLGYDSRDGFRSEEEVLASLGFAWHGRPGQRFRSTTTRQAAHALRHRVALALTRLADWLCPLVEPQRRSSNGVVSETLLRSTTRLMHDG